MSNLTGTTVMYSCHYYPTEVHFFGPAESYFAVNIPLCVINIILLALTVLGNTVVLLTYHRTKTLQTVPNLLLMTLAFSDLVVGLFAQPVFVASLTRNMLSMKPSCLLEMFSSLLVRFCGGVSMLTVSIIISFERYLAIAQPFRHRRWVTKNRMKFLVFLLWSTLFTLNTILILGIGSKLYFIFLSVVITIGALVTAFACSGILRTWRVSRGRTLTLDSETSNTEQTAQRLRLEKKDFKIAKTMFYIMGAIVLCYAPLLVVLVYGQIKGTNELYLKYLHPVVLTLVYLNSWLNPVIYCLRNRRFTQAICTLCGWKSRAQTTANQRCYVVNLSTFNIR